MAAAAIATDEQIQTEAWAGPRASNRIDESDARELRWYFGDPGVAGVFTESSFGAQLERAELFALGGGPCKKCGGDRRTDRYGTGYATKDGKSYASALKKHQKAEVVRLKLKERGIRICDASAVDGWVALGVPAVSLEQVAAYLPNHMVRPCPTCQGVGWVPGRPRRGGAQTARPMGSSVQVGAREPSAGIDEAALARYGKLSRMLELVRAESAPARAALEVYYRPGGGSIGALAWLTDAGLRFFDQADNPLGITPETLLQNERAANVSDPTTERTIIFGRIARESAELWGHACETWNAVTRP